MNRLGIELLTVFGTPPVEFLELAAELGCGSISFALSQFPDDPYGNAPWSVRDDKKLQSDIIEAIDRTGVKPGLGEGFSVREGQSVDVFSNDLELMHKLGVRRVNIVGMDPDLNRCRDEIGVFVDMALARGMDTVTVEFAPGLTIADLPTALQIIADINNPDFKLLVDTMHLIRSGSSAADLAALPPELIAYAQLSDAPLRADENISYMLEATYGRKIPGEGELPLQEIIDVLPQDCIVSLEIPNKVFASQAGSPLEWAERCVKAARNFNI